MKWVWTIPSLTLFREFMVWTDKNLIPNENITNPNVYLTITSIFICFFNYSSICLFTYYCSIQLLIFYWLFTSFSDFIILDSLDVFTYIHNNDNSPILFMYIFLFLKKLYGTFLWMRFICIKATEPLEGNNLFFTTEFPGIPGTHFIDLISGFIHSLFSNVVLDFFILFYIIFLTTYIIMILIKL